MKLGVTLTRGGSQAIRDKNLTLVAGQPLLYYTLRVARECLDSGIIDRYVFASDSAKIKRYARRWAVATGLPMEIVNLPSRLTHPGEESSASLMHVVSARPEADIIVELMATNPCKSAGDVAAVVALADQHGAAVAVTEARHKLERYKMVKDGALVNATGHEPVANRQNMRTCYVRASAVYAWRRDVLMAWQVRFNMMMHAHIMDTPGFAGIDSAADIALAEYWLRNRE